MLISQYDQPQAQGLSSDSEGTREPRSTRGPVWTREKVRGALGQAEFCKNEVKYQTSVGGK